MTTKTKNFSTSKIYKIEPNVKHEEHEIYIGSTTKQYLSQRMTAHRSNYDCWKRGLHKKMTTSFILFEKYGVENCIITLLESVNAKSFDELKMRERHYITSTKCVNKAIPLRTKTEYRQDNKDIIRENNKIYREANKESIKENKKIYYEANKNIIKEKRIVPFICICGSTCNNGQKERHFKSKKHINYTETINK